MHGGNSRAILNLNEVTAYDKAGKVIAPLSTRISGEHSSGLYGLGNCHDGKTDDSKFCHSDSAKEPWLVFGYWADAGISEIVVHNRVDCCQGRIVGATIRICSDSGPH